MVEELYPGSIRSLVPSFKFPVEWYREIRRDVGGGEGGGGSERDEGILDRVKNRLGTLPMTVWTIDSEEDYRCVSSARTATAGIGRFNEDAPLVIANKPMELV